MRFVRGTRRTGGAGGEAKHFPLGPVGEYERRFVAFFFSANNYLT